MHQRAFSFRVAARQTTRTVWLVVAVWVLLLALWSVLPPPFVAADEPQHIDLALDAVSIPLWEWVAPDSDHMGPEILAAEEQLGYYDQLSIDNPQTPLERRVDGRSGEEAVPRDQRLTFADPGPSTGVGAGRINQMPQHPPLYYRLVALLLLVIPGWRDLPFDMVVGIMRMISVLLVAPLPLLAAWTARGLGQRRGVETVAVIAVLTVPQIAHLGSVVTNDSLLIVLGAAATMLLAQVIGGDVSRRTALRIGVVVLAAMLTKSFGLLLPVGVVAAYLAAWRQGHGTAYDIIRSVGVAAAVSALASWWYVENVVRFGSVQPSVGGPRDAVVSGPAAQFLDRAGETLLKTFWGGFGWAETGFDATTATVLTIILLLLVVAGMWRRDSLHAATLLLPATLVVGITFVQSYASFTPQGGIRGIAGRYFATGMMGVVVLAAIGLARIIGRRHTDAQRAPASASTSVSDTVAAGLLLVAAAVVHGLAWLVALRYFWTVGPDDSTIDALRALLSWNPWPPRIVQIVALLLVGSALGLGISLLADARTAHKTGDGDSRPEEQHKYVPA